MKHAWPENLVISRPVRSVVIIRTWSQLSPAHADGLSPLSSYPSSSFVIPYETPTGWAIAFCLLQRLQSRPLRRRWYCVRLAAAAAALGFVETCTKMIRAHTALSSPCNWRHAVRYTYRQHVDRSGPMTLNSR